MANEHCIQIISDLHLATRHLLSLEDTTLTLKRLLRKLKSHHLKRFLCDLGAFRLCLSLFQWTSLTCSLTTLLLQITYEFLRSTESSQVYSSELQVFLRYSLMDDLTHQLVQHGGNLKFLRVLCRTLIAIAVNGSQGRLYVLDSKLLRLLLDCLEKVDHFRTSNICMSCITCLLCCDNASSLSKLNETFVSICWQVFEHHPWRLYILKVICDFIVIVPEPLPSSKRIASVLVEVAKLHGVDRECGSMALAAIISCCERNNKYPLLFQEARLLPVLNSSTFSFEDDNIASLRLYTCLNKVYLGDKDKLTARLIGDGALTTQRQVFLLPAQVMRDKWAPVFRLLTHPDQ